MMSAKYFTKFNYLNSEDQNTSTTAEESVKNISLDDLLLVNRRLLKKQIYFYESGDKKHYVQLKVKTYCKNDKGK